MLLIRRRKSLHLKLGQLYGKVDIDDGRLFLSWTNSDGEYVNQVGDMSLRSGVLVQKNGKLIC